MTERLPQPVPVPDWCKRIIQPGEVSPMLDEDNHEPTLGDLKDVSWSMLVEHMRAEGIDPESDHGKILIGTWDLMHNEDRETF